MSNALQQFQFYTFTLEIIESEGEPWFIASPLAEFLGYQNPARDIRTNVDDEDIQNMYIPVKSNNYICVNESGLYSLVIRSSKPEAKTFKRWVTHEVLPSIRKHGYYLSPDLANPGLDEVTGNLPFQRLNTAKFDTLRKTSRSLAQAYLLECGITPDYVQQQIGQVGHHSAIYGEKTSNSLDVLVERFVEDWKGVGMVIAAPYAHCLSTQALRLFHAWADGKNIPLRMGDNHIIPALARHPDLYSKRVRISRGSAPRALLMIDGLKAPDDVDYTNWLGGCVAEMEMALTQMGVS
ncbi:BRO family protein [Methylobacter tundripaludum]|uniref:BRO family protein n=1 Tax=Methylobacter tundripaludum TaxID=173365 RepID=A0A2S6H5C6_9GAMM|nr:BRO family protein [Methylobacter tundripaludum]PPK72664.1 BRO family protein [Methylobacter tundripaludum]